MERCPKCTLERKKAGYKTIYATQVILRLKGKMDIYLLAWCPHRKVVIIINVKALPMLSNITMCSCFCCSVTQSFLTLRLQGLQHTRLPCPSPSLRACSNSCPSSQWCHPTISSSVTAFSSCLQSFPASESFPMSRLLASGGQSIIGASASASVLPTNIQGWFPLGRTGLQCEFL